MTNRKKSYSIDPKEYKEDGLFYESAYDDLDQSDDNSYPYEDEESNSTQEHTYETPRQQIKRLKRERFFLRRKVEKLSAFKRRVEAYDAYYTVDLTNIEYVRVSNPYGCKEAYVELKQDLKGWMSSGERGNIADYSTIDTEHLQGSKSYLVFSPRPYCGMDLLLEDMRKCRLERLGFQRHRRTTIGCLMLNDGDYVFFWPKMLKEQDDTCSVDSTTDTQSEGL